MQENEFTRENKGRICNHMFMKLMYKWGKRRKNEIHVNRFYDGRRCKWNKFTTTWWNEFTCVGEIFFTGTCEFEFTSAGELILHMKVNGG